MRLPVPRSLLYVTVFALILGTGIVHGLVTDRWVPSSSAEDSAALNRVPMVIEDWVGSNVEPDPGEMPPAGSGEMLLRRYVNRVDGAVVTVSLTVGRAGPIVSSHMPDSCYPGAGYSFASPVIQRSIPAGSDARPQKFRVATFSKTARASPVHVRVFWSWSATGNWEVPDHPRLAFAGNRRLYKLFVIRQLGKSEEPLDGDPASSFIKVLVPELEKALFSDP